MPGQVGVVGALGHCGHAGQTEGKENEGSFTVPQAASSAAEMRTGASAKRRARGRADGVGTDAERLGLVWLLNIVWLK